jgi:hypothetical protein
MASFCGNCGAPVSGTEQFCGKCGARVAPSAAASAVSAGQPQVRSKSSPWLKILLVVIVLLGLGAIAVVGGLYYAFHRGSQKLHELARELPSSSQSLSNPCGYLSSDEVGNAAGVTIVSTRPRAHGCAYIAKGDPGEMLSKHLAATKGSQSSSASGMNLSTGHIEDVEIFSYSVLTGPLQEKIVAHIFDGNQLGNHAVAGVGDKAVVVGNGMMVVRKGNETIQIFYMNCPCSTQTITPLAQKLVSAL